MVHVSNTTTASSEFNIALRSIQLMLAFFPLAPGRSVLEKRKKAPAHRTEGQPICIERAKETGHTQRTEIHH